MFAAAENCLRDTSIAENLRNKFDAFYFIGRGGLERPKPLHQK